MVLKGEDKGLGSMDDAFYIAELWNKKLGEAIGKELGMTSKQIKRKNLLLKNLRELESKKHYTHSTIQRNVRFMKELKKKPLIATKVARLKEVLKKYPK